MMESQQPQQSRQSHSSLQAIVPPASSQIPSRTANSTPVSSPGLFSPANPRTSAMLPAQQTPEGITPIGPSNTPFLHPLQSHKVRETHKALVDTDFTTGRKIINQYEMVEELGRGVHGKVKLARNLENGDNVAIKIIPRFSKKRRLGKITTLQNQDKSKKEIAILKKIRHQNVVALLEVIDDPELKKIYMVLEHVELGEIVWRKKGLPHICLYERRRVEREMRGEKPSAEEERYDRMLEQRQALKDFKRARMTQARGDNVEYWSLEYGPDDDDADARSRMSGREDVESIISRSIPSNTSSVLASRATSRAPSRTQSAVSISRSGTPHPAGDAGLASIPAEDDMETPGPSQAPSTTSTALEGTMYGAYADDMAFRGRSPSMADSIISHMSSIDFNRYDPYADDFSYVPCFTFDLARTTFRDTVLGLEYLHYEGVVHRDIKPANLLWTKEHRVKISDFGVSYFGRPIRDGEPDDLVSESEARDFDNDLELAKTVGTPAFFAPELCYTEALDGDKPQPRVTEQIDVWSLGVTLYSLIFARIPFLAEDEWQMFRKIATEEVYIPRRRLRPVDPSTKPDEKSLYTRVNRAPYRDDDELSYEEIDSDLHDLLCRMLTKNPEKRIRLRDVKRHPWVIKGIDNVVAWLDDTDPGRRASGRKIQVDEKEIVRAVVPLNFLERARSAVKKAVGKVMHGRGDRAESSSRRRAASSAASSAGDSPVNPSTPFQRDLRRRSLKPDDYFAAAARDALSAGEHPLTQSVTASPRDSLHEERTGGSSTQLGQHADIYQTAIQNVDMSEQAGHTESSDRTLNQEVRQKPIARHLHARSVTNAFLSLTPSLPQSQTMPPTPSADMSIDDPTIALRKARDMRSLPDDASRARSVDRGLFASDNKRSEPLVSLSTAVAPGSVHIPQRPQSKRSTDFKLPLDGAALPSPLFFSPRTIAGYQNTKTKSDPSMFDKRMQPEMEERPMTAHRVETVPEAKTPPPRIYNSSTPESFSRAQEQMFRRHRRDYEEQLKRQQLLQSNPSVDPAQIPCPPSPDDELFEQRRPIPSREATMATTAASSSASFAAVFGTPLTSPSETASPLCIANPNPIRGAKGSADHILAFQSDPSLPALLSGASSVSADPEGEFLGNPGVVHDTTDSLTPPALIKAPMAGFPLETQEEQLQQGVIPVHIDDGTGQPPVLVNPPRSLQDDEEADDSDSDEGLTMGKSKRKSSPREGLSSPAAGKSSPFSARRRDTNISIASTDTAKKIDIHSE